MATPRGLSEENSDKPGAGGIGKHLEDDLKTMWRQDLPAAPEKSRAPEAHAARPRGPAELLPRAPCHQPSLRRQPPPAQANQNRDAKRSANLSL